MMRTHALIFAAACLCFLPGCGEQGRSPAATTNASGNPLSAPADYVGALGKAHQSAQKNIGTLGLDQAIKSFSAEEGRNPNSLEELVSKGTISEIPKPPAGMKYDYNPKSGTVKVVSAQ